MSRGAARRPSCFIRDTNGQALAYAYFEDEPGRRAAAHLPTCGMRPGASPPTSPSCRSCCVSSMMATPGAATGGRVVEFEEEEIWLRHRVRRLRAALRITKEPRVEAILRDLIIDADKRLELIELRKSPKTQN